LAQIDKETFTLSWQIKTVDGKGRLHLLYEPDESNSESTFSTEHKKNVEYNRGRQHHIRTVTVKDITEDVQYRIREVLDSLLMKHGIADEDEPS
jgi:hypothetical protein